MEAKWIKMRADRVEKPIKKISVKIRTQFSSSSPKRPELQELGSVPTLHAENVPHMFSSISSPTDNTSGFSLLGESFKLCISFPVVNQSIFQEIITSKLVAKSKFLSSNCKLMFFIMITQEMIFFLSLLC